VAAVRRERACLSADAPHRRYNYAHSPSQRLGADDPVDVTCHGYVLVGDAARGMRYQRESHCSPTNVDVGMMILRFGVLGHPAHGVDTGKEPRKLDRPAQRALGASPAVEVGQCGVYLLIS
jgi:hypothetical protein